MKRQRFPVEAIGKADTFPLYRRKDIRISKENRRLGRVAARVFSPAPRRQRHRGRSREPRL